MLSTITIAQQKNHTHFKLTTQAMLKGLFKNNKSDALESAEKIILTGDISPSLYQALEPLLENRERFFYNGQWQDCQGQLHLVLPNKNSTNPTSHLSIEKTASQSYDEAVASIELALKDEQIPLIFIEGDTGIGKTTTVVECVNRLNLSYTTDILLWLTEPLKYPILFLDEANLAPAGTLEFLTARAMQQTIYYKGQWYVHDSRRKVIGTGNKEHFAYREQHPVFAQHAFWIKFVPPDDARLKEKILDPVFKQFALEQTLHEKLSETLLKIYHLLRKSRDFYVFSLRDFKNLTIRFCYLWQNNIKQQSLAQIVLCAFNQEYFYYFRTEDKQKRMSQSVADLLEVNIELTQSHASRPFIFRNYIFPGTRSLLIESLSSDIDLASQKTKKGILLEGPTGVGKSSIFYALLDDLGRDYLRLECTPDDDTYLIKLIKACLKGDYVVLNEIDLDPRAEPLLNDLLTDHLVLNDLTKNLAKKMQMTPQQLQDAFADRAPGFFVFASKNHSIAGERLNFSAALADRLHCLYIPAYTRKELISLAKDSKVAYPKLHVDTYLSCQSQDAKVNLRKFFESLKFARTLPKSIHPAIAHFHHIKKYGD